MAACQSSENFCVHNKHPKIWNAISKNLPELSDEQRLGVLKVILDICHCKNRGKRRRCGERRREKNENT